VINGDDLVIAHHEAVHACAALHFGRRVDLVIRGRDHGVTESLARTDGDVEQRAVEAGVITLAPFFEDPAGCLYDLAVVEGLLTAGISPIELWNKTAELVSDPNIQAQGPRPRVSALAAPRLDRSRGAALTRCHILGIVRAGSFH
jgi:hypothetical protein